MIYIKISAAVLVIAASFGIGSFAGAFQNKRTEDIRELILFAGIIKANLSYTASEITDIMEEGQKKTKGAVSVWLHALSDRLSGERRDSFENIWKSTIGILKVESYLSDDIICEVRELGKWLCYMDADAQIKNIMLWEKNISDCYEAQQKKAKQINKVSRSLGLLGGIFIVVLIF